MSEAVFRCAYCGELTPHGDAQLAGDNQLICGACYILNPPQQDIDVALGHMAERLAREAREEQQREARRQP